jgi:Glutaminase
MTKRIIKKSVRSFLFAAAFTLLAGTLFYSCKKTSDKASDVAVTEKPTISQRLLSVANVYYTNGGKTVTALFFETPLVHEFSASQKNSAQLFSLLQDAKNRMVPVNVAVAEGQDGLIESVTAASAEELAAFKAEKAQEQIAEEIGAPTSNSRATLAGVIPDVATLNTIFTTLKNQGCLGAGPILYGQCVPFQYVADGCYARAHKMRQIIEGTYGYTSYKVFNFTDQCLATPGVLAVNATLWGNNCCVRWWYHVAPYVYVQEGANQVAYLLDPSMFDAPVAISTWLAAQKNVSCGYAAGTVHKQAYYSSNAYAPSTYNTTTCTINVSTTETYTSANKTCRTYSNRRGC